MNMQDRINELGITLVSSYIGRMEDDGWIHHAWTLVLRRGKKSMVVSWNAGLAFEKLNIRTGKNEPTEPEVVDVLSALASDAATLENARSFEEWACAYGFDPDSRKAEKLYRQVEDQTVELRVLLGEHYDAVIWETDHE